MKRILSVLVCLSLVLVALAGCGASAASGKSLKTGLAAIPSIAKSTDAGEKAGAAKADTTLVAVLVDDSGKIADCKIDMLQSSIGFDTAGKLTTPLDKSFATKQERGAEYGMKAASGIGKEWNEQANALCAYVIGKTIDQVKGIAVNEKGAPTEKE
ncbi:MAG: hypothetical protein RR320_06490, partial [Oscillospiraceae bacterium]